jgi:hypothetical protein
MQDIQFWISTSVSLLCLDRHQFMPELRTAASANNVAGMSLWKFLINVIVPSHDQSPYIDDANDDSRTMGFCSIPFLC